jgi:hypothetical protein
MAYAITEQKEPRIMVRFLPTKSENIPVGTSINAANSKVNETILAAVE